MQFSVEDSEADTHPIFEQLDPGNRKKHSLHFHGFQFSFLMHFSEFWGLLAKAKKRSVDNASSPYGRSGAR